MKKIKILIAIVLVIIMSSTSLQSKAQARVSVSFQFFYDNLSPYGTWISYPQYGYVWRPGVGRGFHPYRTRGHWVWSDEYEWIWVSDYSWGWAPFHYGRWHYDPYYGWLWVPDYDWAPAWVVWGDYGGYYCWAPVGPREVHSTAARFYIASPRCSKVDRSSSCTNWSSKASMSPTPEPKSRPPSIGFSTTPAGRINISRCSAA